MSESVEEVLERALRAFGIGRWADALEGYERALAISSDLSVARAQAGRCKLRLGHIREAVVDLEAAIDQDETPEVVWWVELADAYLGQGEDDKAAANFQEAIERDPSQAEAFAGMGVLYLRKQAFQMAKTALEHAVSLEWGLGAAHNNLAIVYCYLGDYARAAEELSVARNLGYPVDPSFREMLSKQLYARGQTKEEPS
jgi:tetratricopeptide (TPR) repeat protein